MVAASSGGGAHANVQPYLALNWCIALEGEFPQRS
jgi:microcystin-dependent protein